ncbi:hypothetical protein DERP_011203 [Dermatophagoides pteronyssinus]|uniref:Uncharacterized protein n=1 Tax=Dermatophagoides pteronyssinus TaxID=6956 RepID=A0ABQ8JCG6_DERPT|nr:hypothetical protein DERP_011203 [Dermatophagoides pteronyssinus]
MIIIMMENFKILTIFIISLIFSLKLFCFAQEIQSKTLPSSLLNQTISVNNNDKIRTITNRMLNNVRCSFYQKAIIPMKRIFNLSVTIPSDIPEQCKKNGPESITLNLNVTNDENGGDGGALPNETESIQSIDLNDDDKLDDGIISSKEFNQSISEAEIPIRFDDNESNDNNDDKVIDADKNRNS